MVKIKLTPGQIKYHINSKFYERYNVSIKINGYNYVSVHAIKKVVAKYEKVFNYELLLVIPDYPVC